MDKYSRLRPPEQTPEDEICKCADGTPIMLQSCLTYNPISCSNCNLEVNLSRLNFDVELINKIVDWRNFHDCFYRLWLVSVEFEEFAKEQLSNPNSAVNKRGLTLTKEITAFHECFYWWFVDETSSCYRPITQCPKCEQNLTKRKNNFGINTNICRHCNIIIGTIS